MLARAREEWLSVLDGGAARSKVSGAHDRGEKKSCSVGGGKQESRARGQGDSKEWIYLSGSDYALLGNLQEV